MPITENEDGSNINVAELDFEQIKANLREYMSGKPEFADYNFEASGLSFLTDVLANNAHLIGFYANMTHNEGFLDSAVKRDSVVSHAKHIDYVPRSITAARAWVTVAITTTDLVPSIVIDAGTKFTTTIDNQTFQFVTDRAYVALPTEIPGRFECEDVELIQGRYITISTIADAINPNQRFFLGNTSADTSTLIVGVQNSINDSTTVFYQSGDDFLNVERDDTVYWLQEAYDGNYEIYFGDDVIGKSIHDGNVVMMKYIVTDGPLANDANTFAPAQQIGNYSVAVIEVLTQQLAAGGSSAEDIESIRLNSTKGYRAQKRAVTASDYETLLAKNSTIIANSDSVNVWGGEDNKPAIYGKVFVSMKPKVGTVITSALKDQIITTIIKPRNVITITPVIVDPEYLYLEVDVDFLYNSNQTSKTAGMLEQIVRNKINDFNEQTLEFFKRTFRYSRFTTMIDKADKAIDSNLVNLKIKKKFTPRINVNTQYNIAFENAVVPGTLTSSQFIINEPTQQTTDVYMFRDDGVGNVQLLKQLTDLSIVVINAVYGTVNYVTGDVNIASFGPTSLVNSTEISIRVEPNLNDIFSVRNLILSIDNIDVAVHGEPLSTNGND